MMRLKATKTSLYKLVAEHAKLPSMKRTEFVKLRGHRTYWLRWWDEDSGSCEAYLSVGCGSAVLRITKHREGDDEQSGPFHKLQVADLRERGMIEE